MLDKWEQRFVDLATHIAGWSKDPNTKIGAVVVCDEDRLLLSTGYNGMARGVNDDIPIRSSRLNGEKYFWYAHAERNAVYNAARYGVQLAGASIYLSRGMPCTDCAIAIIQSGIEKIICKAGDPTGAANAKWSEEAERSVVMLAEADVEVICY